LTFGFGKKSVINHITSFHRETPPVNATTWHNYLKL